MHLEKSFDVTRSRDEVVELLCRDDTLIGLFPESPTEIVASEGDRRTTRTRYRAMGLEGVATFHFTYRMDGSVGFEKQCDGRVWRELAGDVTVEERGSGSRVQISMRGRTKSLVPEFTIKGQMEEQIDQMTRALRELLQGGSG